MLYIYKVVYMRYLLCRWIQNYDGHLPHFPKCNLFAYMTALEGWTEYPGEAHDFGSLAFADLYRDKKIVSYRDASDAGLLLLWTGVVSVESSDMKVSHNPSTRQLTLAL